MSRACLSFSQHVAQDRDKVSSDLVYLFGSQEKAKLINSTLETAISVFCVQFANQLFSAMVYTVGLIHPSIH